MGLRGSAANDFDNARNSLSAADYAGVSERGHVHTFSYPGPDLQD